MNIVLTGATGYLGSHLAHAFLAEGHRVIALTRRTSTLHRLKDCVGKIVLHDIANPDLSKPFSDHGPVEAVIHTATCYGRAGETPLQIFEANTAIPLRLIEAAIRFNVRFFFNTDTILAPHLNAYALSKKHFADWGRQLADLDRICFVNIRLEHFYGPGDDASKFTTWIVHSCIRNEPEINLTAGEQRRDFIHITDTVAAYVQLLAQANQLVPGYQEIGLGSGKAIRIKEFVEMVHRLTGSSSKLNFGALPMRDHEPMESRADTSRLMTMGWRCRISLQDGITDLIRGVGHCGS